MKMSLKICDKCEEEQLSITMSRDEATLLHQDLPYEVSNGEYPAPVYNVFYERLSTALGARTLLPGIVPEVLDAVIKQDRSAGA